MKRVLNVSSSSLEIRKLEDWRAYTLFFLIFAGFIGLVGRSFYLQSLNNGFLQNKGASRYMQKIEIAPTRGMIVDRNDEPLAISSPVESVTANPVDVEISAIQMKRLVILLDADVNDIKAKLAQSKKDFVYLKRQLPPEQAAKVVEMNIPGVSLRREFQRYYPAGEVFAQVIGFTDVDGKGQEALERAFEDKLRGSAGHRRVIHDKKGQIIQDLESIRAKQNGQQLKLSIDAKIQYLAFRELKKAINEHHAKAGGLIVMDTVTGEILAMVNLPTFNPNNRGKVDPDRTRNRTVTDTFEPGSTLKPFTIATALEQGTVKADSVIQTATGQMTIGKATIHDTHAYGPLTVSQVIQKSSNVGAAKIALGLSSEAMWNMFHQVGFGAQPKSGLPGEVAGRLRAHENWRPIEQATMAFGHGISVSLLQLTRAYSIFATEGELRNPVLLKADTLQESVPVISAKTAHAVRKMLEMVVDAGGTAPKAQVPGYHVAGKSGTAHKVDGRGYAANRYISSFIGFAPASNPRLIISVMIDEPRGGQYYGGGVAAPVFSEVMGGALRMMKVPPDAPEEKLVIPPTTPEVKEEV